jgi:hypothetical protein
MKWLRREPKPPPEPLSPEAFDRLINIYIIRGWTVVQQTPDLVTLDFAETDNRAVFVHGRVAPGGGKPTKHTRKTISRFDPGPEPWLTPQERRMLGEA